MGFERPINQVRQDVSQIAQNSMKYQKSSVPTVSMFMCVLVRNSINQKKFRYLHAAFKCMCVKMKTKLCQHTLNKKHMRRPLLDIAPFAVNNFWGKFLPHQQLKQVYR